MGKPILVRAARQLVTVSGPPGPRRGAAMRELGIIPDGGLLIVDGVIRHVGPSRRIENLAEARSALEISAAGRVVMPGFVDSGVRLVGGAARLDDYERRLCGECDGRPAFEARGVRQSTTRRLALEGQKALKQFIRHGTTTIEATSGDSLDEATARKVLRALGALDGKPLDVHRSFAAGGDTEEVRARVLPELRRRRLARSVGLRRDEGGIDAEQARRLLAAAADLGFLTRVRTGGFAPDDGVRLGVESGAASVDHLAWAGAADVVLLARSPTVATLLPGPSFHLSLDRYPPARALIDAGATVALATGYDPCLSPTCSMPMILSLACTQMGMTPAEAVTAATVNAAHALRSASRCGSLETGKDADLIMLNAADYREIPYQFGVNLVAMTMKRGEPVFPRLGAS
jgi:imidazolonepropionase